MVPDGSADESGTVDERETNPIQAIYDPDGYFRARDPSLGRAVVVVLVAGVLGTAILGGGLWVAAQEMTGTITVDNPERPPDWVCEQEDPPEGFEENCDAPKEVEKRVGDLLWDAAGELLVVSFVGICILWPAWGIGLHLTALLANGQGSLRDSMVLGAWGLVPSSLSVVGGALAIYEVTVGPDFSASRPEQLASKMARATQSVTDGPMHYALIGLGLAFTAWQAYIWAYGLSHAHDVPERRAFVAAGGFALLAYLVGTLF